MGGTAIILLAHGSRNLEPLRQLTRLVELVRQTSGCPLVEIAFREFCQPTLTEALDRCRNGGASRVVLMPYFLFSGGHVTHDLPAELEALRPAYPELELALAEPLGVHPALAVVVTARVDACRTRQGWISVPTDPSDPL